MLSVCFPRFVGTTPEKWYAENCDGDWEHCYGIRVSTIDNLGWAIDIQLEGTYLEDMDFRH
ncbi:Imm53 family immunity protein [Paenibacillus eucommiae]|uniref:Imm53 family immunity protein n=1 Tax=Paenibacillus eucommiae TaxID=1355755 RepID=UPI001AE77EE6